MQAGKGIGEVAEVEEAKGVARTGRMSHANVGARRGIPSRSAIIGTNHATSVD